MAEALALRYLREKHVADVFSRKSFDLGKTYWRQRRVLSWDWKEDFNGTVEISARVRGSVKQPYRVLLRLAPDPFAISAGCSCTSGRGCKHETAVLFAILADAPVRLEMDVERPPELSPELDAWLERLAKVEASDSEEYPDNLRQRLLYVFSTTRSGTQAPCLAVEAVSARLLKDGSFSTSVDHYNPVNVLNATTPKYLRPSDRRILRRMVPLAQRAGTYFGALPLSGEEGPALVEAMIATGRARWLEPNSAVLERGPERRGELRWRLAEDATHRVECVLEGEHALAVALAPPWYIDPASGIMGPVETGLGAGVAEALLLAPGVPPDQSAVLRAAIDKRLPAMAALKPPEAPPATRLKAEPRGRLLLMAGRPHPEYTSPWVGAMPVARLSFLYDGVAVRPNETRPIVPLVRDGAIVEVVRDPAKEREELAHAREHGLEFLKKVSPYGITPEREDDLMLSGSEPYGAWLVFLYGPLACLRDSGWEIEIAPDFPMHLLRADGELDARLNESSGVDWLELDLGVLIDGERVDLLPSMLELITTSAFAEARAGGVPGPEMVTFLRLRDKRTVAIPSARVWPMLSALREIYDAGMIDAKDKGVRFSPLDATDLARFEAATASGDVVWTGGDRLRELGSRLRAAGGMPHVEIPALFTATLRPYQSEGVDWLQFLRDSGFGAVLADDMGLGKTVQTLAHLVIEKEAGRLDRPALIVAPTSVVPNWRSEAERFAPELKVLVLHGPARKGRFDEIAGHDAVITTYPLLHRDRAELLAQQWHVVVLDEAQTIKNPDAIATRLVRELDARHRLCLTGTPVENHLGELWSLFSFLSPGFLGDRQRFNRLWRRPIEQEGNDERRRLLAQRVRPFLLRRTKSEVAAELPPKSEIIEYVDMDAAQRDVYETIRLAMDERVRKALAGQGLARSHIIVLDALLKLRQACCDPRLLKLESAKTMNARSAKLERLMEMLPQLIEDGAHVLLFSQFTSMLALIQEELAGAGIPYVLLTGDTVDRATPIRRFQAGEVPLFLISLKAGGLGLNLTAADTVIHYDPWWNPAVEDQATDRAHRIGQEKPVFVYRMVTTGSIEEKMEQLKLRKRDIAAGIFDPDAGTALDLTEGDIEALFAPVE